jgi:hypothetical protein
MTPQRIETLTWVLIYAGLLALCLGWFVGQAGDGWGTLLMIVGAVVAAVGAVLIVVRARLP